MLYTIYEWFQMVKLPVNSKWFCFSVWLYYIWMCLSHRILFTIVENLMVNTASHNIPFFISFLSILLLIVIGLRRAVKPAFCYWLAFSVSFSAAAVISSSTNFTKTSFSLCRFRILSSVYVLWHKYKIQLCVDMR